MADMSIGFFGDARLEKRAPGAGAHVRARQRGRARAGRQSAEKVGLTRFFRNPRVTADEILRTAAERTGAAAAGGMSF